MRASGGPWTPSQKQRSISCMHEWDPAHRWGGSRSVFFVPKTWHLCIVSWLVEASKVSPAAYNSLFGMHRIICLQRPYIYLIKIISSPYYEGLPPFLPHLNWDTGFSFRQIWVWTIDNTAQLFSLWILFYSGFKGIPHTNIYPCWNKHCSMNLTARPCMKLLHTIGTLVRRLLLKLQVLLNCLSGIYSWKGRKLWFNTQWRAGRKKESLCTFRSFAYKKRLVKIIAALQPFAGGS